MVMIDNWFIKMFERLVRYHKIAIIDKLDETATDALISFQTCNDKIDTALTEMENNLAKATEELDKLKKQINELEHKQDELRELTPDKIMNEWFNGKEGEENGQ